MTERIPLAVVGCGGMGHRHIYGLAELESVGRSPFRLVAACDLNEANARSLAEEAERRFGTRPEVAGDLAALARAAPDLAAVDVCTDPGHHHTIAAEALARGWHVMVEKPMGLTVRACQAMEAAAKHTPGRVLAVAENYRRDPINRLARALLDAGAIGTPRLCLEQGVGGGDRIIISAWRHQKVGSGLLLDVGVHFADILEYLLGEITHVYAQTRLHEPIRHRPQEDETGVQGFYARWPLPETISATAEDAAYAVLTFRSGAVAQYTVDYAGHGRPFNHRLVYGSAGSLELPADRKGLPIRLTTAKGEVYDDARILERVPGFRLDEVTTILFGEERAWEYGFPFEETDRKILAIEYADFGSAIREGGTPEVTAAQGARSVAISYAILESSCAQQTLAVDDVLSGRVRAYQREVDEYLGL
ncbi:MAG: Gfo/Idh/MocA family oxidoreductase [Armatimonadetes bacterium]|nr:Gfo/Idh/MocA family oxidoreductase [Armatimonadota bacterium]